MYSLILGESPAFPMTSVDAASLSPFPNVLAPSSFNRLPEVARRSLDPYKRLCRLKTRPPTFHARDPGLVPASREYHSIPCVDSMCFEGIGRPLAFHCQVRFFAEFPVGDITGCDGSEQVSLRSEEKRR